MSGSFIAITLSGLGLFSLVSLIIRNRKQELAIRKVLGSSFGNNFLLLSKPYLIILVLVCAGFIPLTYFLIEKWKQSFAYSLDVSPLIYAGTLAFIITMIACVVSYQLRLFRRMNITDLIRTE